MRHMGNNLNNEYRVPRYTCSVDFKEKDFINDNIQNTNYMLKKFNSLKNYSIRQAKLD